MYSRTSNNFNILSQILDNQNYTFSGCTLFLKFSKLLPDNTSPLQRKKVTKHLDFHRNFSSKMSKQKKKKQMVLKIYAKILSEELISHGLSLHTTAYTSSDRYSHLAASFLNDTVSDMMSGGFLAKFVQNYILDILCSFHFSHLSSRTVLR